MKTNRIEFNGLSAVEILTDIARMVIVTSLGPRIADFRLIGGENILLWEPGKYKRGHWELVGGHRVWIAGIGADECEDTYAVDNGPCEVIITEQEVMVTGALNPVNYTRRGISVSVQHDGLFKVVNFVINEGHPTEGKMLYAGGIWALTCTVPVEDTMYGVSIGGHPEWDCFNMTVFNRWAGHGQGGYDDPQIQLSDHAVLVTPHGRENKRTVQSRRGIIAMSCPSRKLSFAKKVRFLNGANYPDGCNIAFYIGPHNFMFEMETMGPQVTLRPGEMQKHTEYWALKPSPVNLNDPAQLEAMFEGMAS
jgi:hypothetical protein